MIRQFDVLVQGRGVVEQKKGDRVTSVGRVLCCSYLNYSGEEELFVDTIRFRHR